MSRWQEKTVLVTGGSRGLGRAIAEAFAARGAGVAIAARGAVELQKTAAVLASRGWRVLPLVADVTRQQDIDSLVERTLERFGGLDVLVNNAGRSDRREVLDTTVEDFQRLMEVNFLAAVRMTRAAAPHLLSSRGHVVNIGSLAAKSAARYLGAYPASKFALAAYSQQLRLELGPRGLHVLLVCPGPIAAERPKTEDTQNLSRLPESARRPGGGVRVGQLDPGRVAEEIVRACERRRAELILPRRARLLFTLSQISPRLGDWLVRRMT